MKRNSLLKIISNLFFVSLGVVILVHTVESEEKTKKESSLGGALQGENFGKLPTYINSKSLEVDSEKRIFYYRVNVVAKQGDMTLTCDELEGHYNENNQIEKMIAKKNVVIVKGIAMKATSQHGVYDTQTGIITLTENPKLEQNGSTLQADVVKVFVNEDRSVAEGDVSVTVNNQKTPTPGPVTPLAVTPIVAPTETPIPGVMKLGSNK